MITNDPQNHFLQISGIRTHISRLGAGKPLVLVHGLGGPLMWQRVVVPLAQSFDIITIDLPGFGESDSPTHNFSTQEYADFLLATLDRLDIPKATLAGISYGGQICAHFAYKYPVRTERLVLIASTGLMRERFVFKSDVLWFALSKLISATALRSERFLCRSARRSFYNIESRPSDLCRKFYEQLFAPGHRTAWLNCLRNAFTGAEELRAMLPQISAPTQIIWGKEDKTVSPACGEEFHRLIPRSSLLVIPECAHSVPLEKPAELIAALSAYQ